LAVDGLPVEAAGGGVGESFDDVEASGASFAGGEFAGAEESGTVLEWEAVAFFSFFLGTGGT
jgi:hypothetical protein